jgi:ABC-type antimicrobial peptide transport system permease subunit
VFLDRMIGTLSAAFAIIATVLAAVGLYGVLAYTVAERTREFGVRMALGANTQRMRVMVLRQVAGWTVIGGTIGLAAAIAVGRAVQSLLFEIEAHDPIVVISVAGVVALVAVGAAYVPAYHASRLEPMTALRSE